MLKRLWLVPVVAVAFATPALAGQPRADAPPPAAALPDFPPDAEPGACYARMRVGAGDAAADKGVWTLRRGHGPEAVWSYSEPGAAPGAPSGAYRWVRVFCEDGRTPFAARAHAHRGPATGTTGAGLEPPPPPFAAPPPPPMEPLPPPPHHPVPPPHHAVPPPGPGVHLEMRRHAPQEPPVHFEMRRHGPPMHPPHHGPMFPGPHMMEPPHFVPPMGPPPLTAPPRWFGDRYLSWPGKRPPVW